MISFDISAVNADLDRPHSVEIFIVKRRELGEKEINFESEKRRNVKNGGILTKFEHRREYDGIGRDVWCTSITRKTRHARRGWI